MERKSHYWIKFETEYGVKAKNEKEAIRIAEDQMIQDLGGFEVSDVFTIHATEANDSKIGSNEN